MTTFDTPQQWGALLSHHSEDLGALQEFASQAEAVAHGRKIAAAQPGIEFEVMTRTPGDQWMSAADGETLQQVIVRRWPRF